MRYIERIVPLAILGVVMGCETNPPEMLVTPPTICQGQEQCDQYWSRAQAWLVTASLGRVHAVSETYLQTRSVGLEPQYMLMREVRDDGVERLRLNVYCADILFGCTPAPDVAYRDFHLYVTGEIDNQSTVLNY